MLSTNNPDMEGVDRQILSLFFFFFFLSHQDDLVSIITILLLASRTIFALHIYIRTIVWLRGWYLSWYRCQIQVEKATHMLERKLVMEKHANLSTRGQVCSHPYFSLPVTCPFPALMRDAALLHHVIPIAIDLNLWNEVKGNLPP